MYIIPNSMSIQQASPLRRFGGGGNHYYYLHMITFHPTMVPPWFLVILQEPDNLLLTSVNSESNEFRQTHFVHLVNTDHP